MNKHENKLAFSVLATLTTLLVLIYVLIMYREFLFAVMGVSILFLITSFILTQNIIAFSISKAKSTDTQIKTCIDDISAQLDALSGAQAQVGKATFLYTKQAAQSVTALESHYTESQAALYKSLVSLSNAQNKATKLMIKYDQSNTTKLISSIKDMRNHLSETMIQGFDQIQPNNSEIVSVLEDITNYLKSQPSGLDQSMGIQLNNVAHELQNISNSIQKVQMPLQTNIVNTATAPTATIETPAVPEVAEDTNLEEPAIEDIAIEESETEEIPVTEAVVEEPVVEEPVAEAPAVPLSDDPNKQLSADEIAALFAAAEPAPKKEEKEEPVIEDIEIETEFTPTFTVVGKEDTAAESVSEPTVAETNEDPNKMLSADEIAALFAAAEPEPQKEEPQEPPTITPVSDDPNKQLSADEIAALFAQMG